MPRRKPTVGILTGGGNCPGLDDATLGVTERALKEGWQVLGIPHGYEGLLSGKKLQDIRAYMTGCDLRDLHRSPEGVLELSRENPTPKNNLRALSRNAQRIAQTIARNRLQCIIAIGGDDTLTALRRLVEQGIVQGNGVPKTIDNDIVGTDRSFGFETAVQEGVGFAHGMRREAKKYGRASIMEVMGRKAGWLTLEIGERADADVILIPEVQVLKAKILEHIRETMKRNRNKKLGKKGHALVLVSEGFRINGRYTYLNEARDPHGNHKLGGIRSRIEKWLKQAGIAAATHAPEYGYRYGAPTKEDAAFAYRLGWRAMDAAIDGEVGVAAVLRQEKIILAPLSEIRGGRTVPRELYDAEKLRKRS